MYSLPAGTSDFTPNTTIESSKIDSLTADLESTLNTAWPVSLGGTGGSATAAWTVAPGTVSLPGLAFVGDTNSGFYQIGADNWGFAANGAKVLDIATTGLGVTGTLASSGALSAGTSATVTTSDDGATLGPLLDLYRISTTVAASDIIGGIQFNGRDSAANKEEYASLEGVILDATSGSEDGRLDVYAKIAGARTKIAGFGPSAVLRGTATNDDAAAGYVGEEIKSEILTGSSVAISNATAANITSISLTAGDWDIDGNVVIATGVGNTSSSQRGWISTVSATPPTLGSGAGFLLATTIGAAGFFTMPVGTIRASLSGTTTYYLGVSAGIAGGGGTSAYGYIRARRRR